MIGYGSVGALIFSLYLVYDTQLMLGGKHKYSLRYIGASAASSGRKTKAVHMYFTCCRSSVTTAFSHEPLILPMVSPTL
jgi:hypothetical protein